MSTPLSRREAVVTSLVIAAAVALLCWWLFRVNAAMPLIIDEVVYLWQAELLASGRLTDHVPAHPDFVNLPFIPIHGDRRFGQYPLGFPLALVPWVAAGIPWGLNVALGAVALFLMHRFARDVGGPALALVAMILLALSPFFIAQSTIFLAHPLVLAATLLLLRCLQKREAAPGRARWPLAAGAAVGYTLNVAPVSAVPLALAAAARVIAARRTAIPGTAPATRREIAAFLIPIAAGAGLFCAVNLATTGSPWTPAYYASSADVRPGFGPRWGVGNYTPAAAWRTTIERVNLLDKFLFGWPRSSLMVAAAYVLVSGARSLRRVARGAPRPGPDGARGWGSPTEGGAGWDLPLLTLVVSTLGTYAFWYFHGNGDSWGPRYLYATLPAFVLFTARGLVGAGSLVEALADRVGRAVSGAAPPGAPLVRRALPFAAVAALTIFGTIPYLARLADDPFLRWRRATHDLLERLESRGIDRGTIFVESVVANTYYAPLLYESRFDDAGPLVFAKDRGLEPDARFAQARGDLPVHYVRPDFTAIVWEIHDEHPWVRRQSEGPQRPRPAREGERRAPD
jgi:hypothetical protein